MAVFGGWEQKSFVMFLLWPEEASVVSLFKAQLTSVLVSFPISAL